METPLKNDQEQSTPEAIRLLIVMLNSFNHLRSSLVSSLSSLTFKRFRYTAKFGPSLVKAHKGRVPVRIGGSTKGSTVVYGDYGIRLATEGTRITQAQLKEADNILTRYVRKVGGDTRLYPRLVVNIPVFVKGNETRMGKGKGDFDHWMCRVPTGRVLFELKGTNLHEKMAREAFRKVGCILPGVYDFVMKGSLPRVGLKAFKDTSKIAKVNYLSQSNDRSKIKELSMSPEYSLYKNR